jgi:trans-aconitate 2-methyltransferase
VPPQRAWRGSEYDRLSTPQAAWGVAVLDRLQLRGDETVLDAGCGSGRVTEALVERLPRGRVIGVDGSASMIEAARRRLGDRADLRVMDLLELDLGGERVDAILSTATLHWILDHPRLFAALRRALRDGGRLAAQCGGAGNLASLLAAAEATMATERFVPCFAGWRRPWRFATAEQAEEDLRAAGFGQARAWLHDEPVVPEDPLAYLTEVNLGAHLERVPHALRAAFVDEVVERLGGLPVTLGYVRLNLDATA